jgi:hypothetical protein
MIRARAATYSENRAMNPSAASTRSMNWNRWAYGLLTVTGLLSLLLGTDRSLAPMLLCFALVADPFDQRVTWKERPLWQRAWLVVHLAVAAAAFGWSVGLGDRG